LTAARAEHDDRPELVREVDHVAFFPSADALELAAARLLALGYRVDPPTTATLDTAGKWQLAFHRDEALHGGRADAFTWEILDVIVPLGGDYDGWGAVIETGE
jgi:hypothetical protein